MSFLDKAAESDKEIRRTQEKDPADLSGAKEPDWDNPDSWGGSGDKASDSASGNAGDSADGKENQEQPEPKASKRKAAPTRSPMLRRGRPQGPPRKAVTARILMRNNRMLTKAVEKTGKLPQTIFDEALEAYFKRLKIEDPGEEATTSEDFDAA